MLHPVSCPASWSGSIVIVFCALACAAGVLFGWALRELPQVVEGWGLPLARRRRRRRRTGYYFADDHRSWSRSSWTSRLAWGSAILISLALTLSAVVMVESKKPSENGSIRRHS